MRRCDVVVHRAFEGAFLTSTSRLILPVQRVEVFAAAGDTVPQSVVALPPASALTAQLAGWVADECRVASTRVLRDGEC